MGWGLTVMAVMRSTLGDHLIEALKRMGMYSSWDGTSPYSREMAGCGGKSKIS